MSLVNEVARQVDRARRQSQQQTCAERCDGAKPAAQQENQSDRAEAEERRDHANGDGR